MIFDFVTNKIFKKLLDGKIAAGDSKKLGGKSASEYALAEHDHTKAQIIDFPSSMPASDVLAWAKASTKPSYTKAEVGLSNVDNTADSAKSVNYATSAGSATKATNDHSGRNIYNTYKTKAESANIIFTEASTTAPSDATALWAHL